MRTINDILKEIFIEAEKGNWALLQVQIACDQRLSAVVDYYACRDKVMKEFNLLVGEAFDHFSDEVINDGKDIDGADKLKAIARMIENDPLLESTFAMDCCLQDGIIEL